MSDFISAPTLVSMLRHSVSDGASMAVSVVILILILILNSTMTLSMIITIVQLDSYVNTCSKYVGFNVNAIAQLLLNELC
jgi:hypothetical protein